MRWLLSTSAAAKVCFPSVFPFDVRLKRPLPSATDAGAACRKGSARVEALLRLAKIKGSEYYKRQSPGFILEQNILFSVKSGSKRLLPDSLETVLTSSKFSRISEYIFMYRLIISPQ